MLSTQFIIEGSAIVCDARGWSLESVSLCVAISRGCDLRTYNISEIAILETKQMRRRFEVFIPFAVGHLIRRLRAVGGVLNGELETLSPATPCSAAKRQTSDGVLAVLQDAANIGLARYPERLGQLFLVNVPPDQAVGVLIAARALGLGQAIDSGKLRVLPGELPKWAPELRKVGYVPTYVGCP